EEAGQQARAQARPGAGSQRGAGAVGRAHGRRRRPRLAPDFPRGAGRQARDRRNPGGRRPPPAARRRL
ncbi:MAG: hypothetical protein AVDCRST_MAG89-1995, partial [uncultured Gemmatimonadetes bacterium]